MCQGKKREGKNDWTCKISYTVERPQRCDSDVKRHQATHLKESGKSPFVLLKVLSSADQASPEMCFSWYFFPLSTDFSLFPKPLNFTEYYNLNLHLLSDET